MNISMQLFLVLAACLCLSEGAPDGRLARKQQRPTRGFKNVEMMTARGFGKRDRPHTRAERDVEQTFEARARKPTFKSPKVSIARDFGKRATGGENEESFGSPRKIFKPKNSLMVAYDFGKRSSNDYSDEEEEIRVTRGTFKPSGKILIARGYGKRDYEQKVQTMDEDYGSNKGVVDMDDFLETLASSPEKELYGTDDKTVESMPLDLLVMEMMNNPDFTRSVVRKFIDLNKDGMLSLDELLRNEV